RLIADLPTVTKAGALGDAISAAKGVYDAHTVEAVIVGVREVLAAQAHAAPSVSVPATTAPRKALRRGWVAGSSPAMTTAIVARDCPSPGARHSPSKTRVNALKARATLSPLAGGEVFHGPRRGFRSLWRESRRARQSPSRPT